MAELLKKEREIVLPGEELVRSMEFLPGRNCFRDGDAIIAKKLGLLGVDHRVISVVPLNSPYLPRTGDMVIGEVIEVQHNGWVVWIDAPHDAFLPLSGVREYIDTRRTSLTKYYDIDDVIYAKVSSVEGRSIYLSMQDIKANLQGADMVFICAGMGGGPGREDRADQPRQGPPPDREGGVND